MTTDVENFGKWRAFFFPIHKSELKKFIPMLCIYALAAFVYGILRPLKESLVVTAKQSGAEVLPFMKVWAILPAAILMMFFFTRLSNRYSREKVFYIMVSIFLGFFLLFAFFIFPAHEFLHPHAFADRVQSMLPEGLKGFVALFRNWTFTLFYVIADLWNIAIMTVLFWGFANEITTVKEARRYYVLWSIGANLAGIFAARAAVYLSEGKSYAWLPFYDQPWQQSVFLVNCIVILCGLLLIGFFRYLNGHLGSEERGSPMEVLEAEKKPALSMRHSFAYLFKSKYLLSIAVIVLAYNLTLNLVDIVWKNQIKEVYPNPSEYSGYMAEVMTWLSVIATGISIFVSGKFIRKFSWTASALVTPLITLTTGTLFFGFVMMQYSESLWLSTLLGASPAMLSMMVGSFHCCMVRACKQTLFDATKEMSFIPLSSESKLKGKAAIDGVGSRLGKSGGSMVYQGLLVLFATVSATTPYVAIIFFLVMMGWIFATVSLGKQFVILNTHPQESSEGEPESELQPS